ncbi:MAG: restriction endonuclease [Veillonellaceae bacterium]|nr:restriction endonuclease [Veillonellaceae bacterium]
MAVPKYNELMPYVIQALGDGNIHTIKELEAFCVDALQLSVEDRQELLPSGRQTALINRLNWAKTYLQKAGLVVTPKRGNHQLTDLGKKAFADGPEKVTLNYLKQFDSYNEFVAIKKEDGKIVSAVEEVETKSPQDMLDEAISQMNASLADDLMTEIMKISSYEFERLVVRLLLKMGYGTLQLNKEAVTQKTNDEGIDGIVTADKFGFDSVYIQAKQWKKDSTVSRPEVQKFLGALVSKGASKGLFITTSTFTKGAIDCAKEVKPQKVVLVDGEQLAKLMIEYNLGVSTVETYEVKRVDYDFFNEDV